MTYGLALVFHVAARRIIRPIAAGKNHPETSGSFRAVVTGVGFALLPPPVPLVAITATLLSLQAT
jgi:hypothetical protein